jgi:dsDNA-specific endonuclease/ATPase MutS2
MEYLLVPDEGIPRNSDALAVATLLGMDPTLASRAERFFLEGNETTS